MDHWRGLAAELFGRGCWRFFIAQTVNMRDEITRVC
ncbi:MAG: hypothetical protein ACI9HB_002808, partial [Gammaproteobacteria bacterium]